MRIFYFISILIAFSLVGCRLEVKNSGMFTRVNIPPAGKGAPKFNPDELIHEDVARQEVKFEISQEELNSLAADKLITKAWTALGAGAYDTAIKIAQKVLERFSGEAKREQASLAGQFPKAGKEENYKELNAAGTALYIIAEAYEKKGMCKQALNYYRQAIKEFPLSQNWDPRGWYWKVKEEAQAKIEKLKESSCE